MSIAERVTELAGMVERGEFVESFPRFYAPEAEVQENDQPPRVGIDALIRNERRILATFQKVSGKALKTFVSGNEAIIHWSFEFITGDDTMITLDELAHQTWQDDLIIREKFYYDPAQTLSPKSRSIVNGR